MISILLNNLVRQAIRILRKSGKRRYAKQINTENQLSNVTFLFRDSLEINLLMATNFCNQEYSDNGIPDMFISLFTARIICDDEALSKME